jgi:hypothetical protein
MSGGVPVPDVTMVIPFFICVSYINCPTPEAVASMIAMVPAPAVAQSLTWIVDVVVP